MSSWAATVRWRDCSTCLPRRTLAALPRDGIAIQVTLSSEQNVPVWVKPLRWPPPLRPVSGLEGLPQRVGVVQRIGRVRGFVAYVWVFFGRPRPTHRQLALAHAELRAARLP